MKNTEAFFSWLRCNLDGLFSDEAVQKALTEKLAKIDPAIRWEVGPADGAKKFFAFSPNLDLKLLPMTEMLARTAPKVPGWMFLSSKPPKAWKSRSIQIADKDDRVIQYNLDGWLYYLTSFNDGEFFDVNLVPYGYEDRAIDELKHVASLLVEFELGERISMEFIDRTNIVLPSQLNAFGNRIENLRDQLLQELSKKDHH